MSTIPQTTDLTIRSANLPAYLPTISPDAIEQALAIGDMAKMSPEVRVAYYVATCQSAGLNPMTRPFDLIKGDDGAIRMYPNKVAAEQLRKLHRVSNKVTERRMDVENGLFFVTVQASTPDGREDEAQGIVDIVGKKGTPLANALMKAETKAKRRATLSLCGLGYEDSEDVAGHPVRFDYQQGGLPEPPAFIPEHTTAAQAADDLYGDGAGEQLHNGYRRTTTVIPDDDIPEKLHGGQLYLDQIDAAWRAGGLNEAQIISYWVKTCKRFKVERREQLRGSLLPILLNEVREWLQRQEELKPDPHELEEDFIAPGPVNTMDSTWRIDLPLACKGVQDKETLDAVWEATLDPNTPDAVGEALLERVQRVAAEAGTVAGSV